MSDQELVVACCDVIVWMLTEMSTSQQTVKQLYRVIPKAELVPHAEATHRTMEVLGDLMNAHDSVQPEDEWINEFFHEMQKRFPTKS